MLKIHSIIKSDAEKLEIDCYLGYLPNWQVWSEDVLIPVLLPPFTVLGIVKSGIIYVENPERIPFKLNIYSEK